MIMEYRTLELNLTSARVFKDVNYLPSEDELFSDETGLCAVVSLLGNQEFKSPVRSDCGTDPEWNFPVKFIFEESLLCQDRLILEITLRRINTVDGAETDIGMFHVPLRQLFLDITKINTNTNGNDRSLFFSHVNYLLRELHSGDPTGVLYLSYKFGGKLASPRVLSFPTPTPLGVRNPRQQHQQQRRSLIRSLPPPLQRAAEYMRQLSPRVKKNFKNGFNVGIVAGGFFGLLLVGQSTLTALDATTKQALMTVAGKIFNFILFSIFFNFALACGRD